MSNIALIGTCDTKLEELLFLRQQILDNGANSVLLIDVGRSPIDHESISISQKAVTQHGDQPVDLQNIARGEVIKHMIKCATSCVAQEFEKGSFHGIISAGGSGGTSLAAAVMREALPIGFPKLIVSTVASGDTSPLIGETDICLMYSVVDIAGNNSLLSRIFANAAGAIVGMVKAYKNYADTANHQAKTRKRVGVTMFGVTTPAVTKISEVLTTKYNCEVYVFHATGSGGRAMERLVREGGLDAVLDLTTTEICDHLMGGNMSAGPSRLEAAAEAGIPYVVSLGATSMVNFGPRSTVPEKYNDRLLLEHNPTVTLMRTEKQECVQIGDFIVNKLKSHCKNPQIVQIVLPLGGVCMISTPGGPFENKEADQAMFETIRNGLKGTDILLVEEAKDINDPGFAEAIAGKTWKAIMIGSIAKLML